MNRLAFMLWLMAAALASAHAPARTISFSFTFQSAAVNRVLSAAEIAALAGPSGPSGLIGHWPLDDGTNPTSDASGNGNVGTLYNGPSWIAGRVGSGALNFNSGAKVATGSRTWGFTTTGTMAAWIRTTSTASITVASLAHDLVQDEMMLAVNYFVVGKVQIFAHSSSGQLTYRSSSTSVNDGNWHFVVGMLDGGVGTANLRIFVDGFEETGTAYFYGTVQPLSDSTPRFFTIGDRSTTNPGFSTPFNGSIDDVRLYNRVLSASEVLALWNGTTGGGSSGGGGAAGSNWTLASNGETRYLYDGRRVIQERDGNNTPTVSYTRGLDLSGMLGGAGGIGGLLARSTGYSPSGGTWGTHHFYHADGNGNITALIDNGPTPVVQATYTYDPFGRATSSGPLADANVYRFSSKQIHPGSGLYYYGFRFYEPNLQRWLNRDPIREGGGINLFGFVGNEPINNVDPDGEAIQIAAVCGAILEIGSTAYDLYTTAATVADPNATGGDIALSVAGTVAGLGLPGPGNLYVKGAKKVSGGVKAAARADDAAKVAKPPILLGENMKRRVIPDAKELGMDYYKPRSKIPENWFKNNMRWIRDKIKEGREFFTKGRDPKRIRKPNDTDYYGGEMDELKKANCPVKELP